MTIAQDISFAPATASQQVGAEKKGDDTLQTYIGAPGGDAEDSKARDNLETTHEGEYGTKRDLVSQFMYSVSSIFGTEPL